MEDRHEPIVERIIHRLVRKHIAGTTMESALEVAKDLNSRNIGASLTFLSSNVTDKAKAKYITTTYSELARRIARSGIRAGMHVPLEQLGAGMDSGLAMDNFNEIVKVGNRHGVFVWADPDGVGSSCASSISRMKGVGLAIDQGEAEGYAKHVAKGGAVKLLFKGYEADGKSGAVRRLDELRKLFSRVVVSYMPEKAVSEVLKNRSRNDVDIEFEYGYSERKMGRAIRKGARVSVLVPFGKDWIKYAMNSAPEGYMRFVAGKLLKEGEQDVA